MNFAFNSIIIVLLILPGFIFSLALYNSDEPFVNTPLTNRTIISLFATIILHLIWTHFFCTAFPCQINYKSILEIVAGTNIDKLLVSTTTNDLLCFSYYIISIYVFAYVVGIALNILVKKFKLDSFFNQLRLESPWFYLLNGYNWEVGEPDLIIITAAIDVAGRGYLYNGGLAATMCDFHHD